MTLKFFTVPRTFVNCTYYEIRKILLFYLIATVLSTPKSVLKKSDNSNLDQVCTCNSRGCLFIWTKYFKNVRHSQQSQELDQNLHDNGIDFTESYRRINTHGMRELVNIEGISHRQRSGSAWLNGEKHWVQTEQNC